jgi:hypothetical protein
MTIECSREKIVLMKMSPVRDHQIRNTRPSSDKKNPNPPDSRAPTLLPITDIFS